MIEPLHTATARVLRRTLLPAVLLGLASGGCENPLEPRKFPVADAPSETVLHDFRSSRIIDRSGFDVVTANPVRVDQTSSWDFVFFVADGGVEQFRPRSVIAEGDFASGLQRVESTFEGLETAPGDGYVAGAPVPVEEGAVYAARSRQDPNVRRRCRHFMKLEVLSVSPSEGTVSFRYLWNPNCEQRILVPGEGGDS